MNIIGIIPARFASTRFPGKPLIDLGGKTMIQRVYEKASEVIEHVFVATDSPKIFTTVKGFGGLAIMTRDDHRSGTDRIAEAYNKIIGEVGSHFDVVINIQGDEPFLYAEQLTALIKCFDDDNTDIGTLVKRIENTDQIFNPNMPKVVFNNDMYAQYFSRSPIPFVRECKSEEWINNAEFFRHIGLYGYRTGVLMKISKLKPSSLEKAENLEQLRWLENGYKIKVAVTQYESIGIDTPEDLDNVRSMGLIP